jgi:hypothetical protein
MGAAGTPETSATSPTLPWYNNTKTELTSIIKHVKTYNKYFWEEIIALFF